MDYYGKPAIVWCANDPPAEIFAGVDFNRFNSGIARQARLIARADRASGPNCFPCHDYPKQYLIHLRVDVYNTNEVLTTTECMLSPSCWSWPCEIQAVLVGKLESTLLPRLFICPSLPINTPLVYYYNSMFQHCPS